MNTAPAVITYAAALRLLAKGLRPGLGTLVTMPQTVSGDELRATLGAQGVRVENAGFPELPGRKSYPFAVYRVI